MLDAQSTSHHLSLDCFIRIMELEELIGTTSFKLSPSIKVERPVNIPIPKVIPDENGETGDGDKETVGKKRKVSAVL